MHFTTLLPHLLALLAVPARAQSSGTGPYPAKYTTSTTLPKHTIYLPSTLPFNQSLPVIAWGNGGCMGRGLTFSNFLTEIASYGFMIVANGAPDGRLFPQTTAAMLTATLDWAEEASGEGGEYQGRLDTGSMAVAGQSCGGLEAINVGNDTRVRTVGVFNSGLLDMEKKDLLDRIRVPVYYFLGGSGDIAYPNGERDYADLPAGLPAWKANFDVGHMGTYSEANGGEFGKAAVAYFKWALKGDTAAKALLIGNPPGLAAAGWDVVYKNMA